MLIQANNVCASLDALLPGREDLLAQEVARAVGATPERLSSVRVLRSSVDARKRSDVHFVLNVQVEVKGLGRVEDAHPKKGVQVMVPKEPQPCAFPDLSVHGAATDALRPIVVGAGPAGLFCALALARAGLRPLLIERGRPVEERMRDVRTFADGGRLDEQSNIQFGEGGAGTFSDGKLTTGTKSPFARFVLEEFVACGAPEDILVEAKPHIGTDFLPKVVRGLRERIIQAGGEVRFSTQLVSIAHDEGVHSSTVLTARMRDLVTGEEREERTSALILAVGHSARDTFGTLHAEGFAMERKPFAVGVRIEHEQRAIDRAQYGASAGHPALPPADYKLAVHTRSGRGVYTFCMCPGGDVVAAASEAGGVCVNGMSNHARDGETANSALLVEVKPEDLPTDAGVLAGVRFQRDLEQAAFRIGGESYAAPMQTVGSFLAKESGRASHPSATYPRGVVEADLHDIFPAFVTDAMAEALPLMGRKLRGFDAPCTPMTAVEARSSSPVRIVRDRATLQSVSHVGVYPTGEGAGYAGGIMSAACDGMRVAFAVMSEVQVRAAADAMRQGLPAVFPTDTVVGLGVAVAHVDDGRVLARIKGRDEGKPVAWLVGSVDDLDRYGRDVPAYARELAQQHWPGPCTLIVSASDAVPKAFQTAAGTIGLRMPASTSALRLIHELRSPVATTSANLAGEPAPLSPDDLSSAFSERACGAGAAFVRVDERASGTASTVIDCTQPKPRILREGSCDVEDMGR